ncbi:MAG: hypothetical protein SW127_18390 [Actinomycetota bacterium]|nr:hypothetical protein [Actinomycetota bacterium]
MLADLPMFVEQRKLFERMERYMETKPMESKTEEQRQKKLRQWAYLGWTIEGFAETLRQAQELLGPREITVSQAELLHAVRLRQTYVQCRVGNGDVGVTAVLLPLPCAYQTLPAGLEPDKDLQAAVDNLKAGERTLFERMRKCGALIDRGKDREAAALREANRVDGERPPKFPEKEATERSETTAPIMAAHTAIDSIPLCAAVIAAKAAGAGVPSSWERFVDSVMDALKTACTVETTVAH